MKFTFTKTTIPQLPPPNTFTLTFEGVTEFDLAVLRGLTSDSSEYRERAAENYTTRATWQHNLDNTGVAFTLLEKLVLGKDTK